MFSFCFAIETIRYRSFIIEELVLSLTSLVVTETSSGVIRHFPYSALLPKLFMKSTASKNLWSVNTTTERGMKTCGDNVNPTRTFVSMNHCNKRSSQRLREHLYSHIFSQNQTFLWNSICVFIWDPCGVYWQKRRRKFRDTVPFCGWKGVTPPPLLHIKRDLPLLVVYGLVSLCLWDSLTLKKIF